MAGREHRDEGLAAHRAEPQPRFVRGRLAQQADVDAAVVQGGELGCAGHLPDVQPHARVALPEGAQQARQNGQGERSGEADPQPARLAAADGAGGRQPVRQVGQDPARGGQQLPPGRGEGDAAGLAPEQRVADLLLQPADLLAQRRLGDAEAGGGPAEVQFLGEHGEGVQLREGEFGAGLHTSRDIRSARYGYWTYPRRPPSVRPVTERRAILSGSTFEEQIGYARAVVDGDWVHVSGTTGFDYTTMTISPDVVEQAEQCLRNIAAALAEAGSGFADVVRVRYLLPERADFEPCWPVLRRCFGEVRPAATMQVCGLADPRMRIEIEVTARRPAG